MKNLNFGLSHVKRAETPYSMQSKHYHDQFEIYYLLDGERYYFIDNQTYHVKKGYLVLIGKNILHKTNTANKYSHERILVQFDETIIKGIIGDFNDINLFNCFKTKQYVYSLNPKEQLQLEHHLFNMLKEEKERKVGYLTYIKVMLVELLLYLNRLEKTTPFTNSYLDQTHEKISEIAIYINLNFNQKLSLCKLSKLFNYNPSYLSRAFKEVTGFTFVEYKNNVRIKEASKYLQQNNFNITEIAGKVGYNNSTHFGRIFKRITGYSPTEYKNLTDNL